MSEACDAYGWAAAAESAAQAAGVNLGLYQHRVIVLPSNVTCTWAGLGNVGCGSYCRAWVKTCNLQDVYAHEIGHNVDGNGNGSIGLRVLRRRHRLDHRRRHYYYCHHHSFWMKSVCLVPPLWPR